MKTRLLVLAALTISFAVPTFAQQKDAVDPQLIEQLAQIDKKYAEATNNNDAAAVAALFTEDAVFVTQDTGLLYGRQAIEKQYAEWFKGAHASDHIGKSDPNCTRFLGTTVNIMTGGEPDNVMRGGEWSATWQGQGQKPEHLKGYWTSINTREGDDWKIRMLTVNTTPPPAATTASTETK
jgi:uncharacterized protein (TIGR02246 family)